MASSNKGRATIRFAAVLLTASAVFEIMDASSAVALLGGVRTGAAAAAYHFVFSALYLSSGIGMWKAKPWGYSAFMATTAVYTIDKVQLISFRDALYDHIFQQLTATRDLAAMIPKHQLTLYFTIGYVFLMLCWWGFALYVHMRRHYFHEKHPA